MFALSLIFEDGAIYELTDFPSQRSSALFLVGSSYVTWTWQMHTFSNSIETLAVLWSLVFIKRLKACDTLELPTMLDTNYNLDCSRIERDLFQLRFSESWSSLGLSIGSHSRLMFWYLACNSSNLLGDGK